MFTPDQILAQISNLSGLPRGNRYSAQFPIPPTVATAGDFRALSLMCDAVVIPGTTINTADFSPLRNLTKLPTGYQHEDIEVSFILDGKYTAKKMFDSWVAAIVNPNTYRISYVDYIKTDILIAQLDTLGNEIFKVKLIGAYPVSVGQIQLGNENEGIQKLAVTFTFERIIEERVFSTLTEDAAIAERKKEGTDVSAVSDRFEIEEGTTSGATETIQIENPTEVKSQEDYAGQTMPGDGLFGRAQRAVDFVRSFF